DRRDRRVRRRPSGLRRADAPARSQGSAGFPLKARECLLTGDGSVRRNDGGDDVSSELAEAPVVPKGDAPLKNGHIGQGTLIDEDVTIAPAACFANDPHPGSKRHACMRGPTIEPGAQIGMNATILPFVTIGERSVVGAGSVVTSDVGPELVVAGNPAHVLKTI